MESKHLISGPIGLVELAETIEFGRTHLKYCLLDCHETAMATCFHCCEGPDRFQALQYSREMPYGCHFGSRKLLFDPKDGLSAFQHAKQSF